MAMTGKDKKEIFGNFIKDIEGIKSKIGIKKTVADCGMDEKKFLDTLGEMVEQAFDDQCTGVNTRYPLMEEIKNMYLKAFYRK